MDPELLFPTTAAALLADMLPRFRVIRVIGL